MHQSHRHLTQSSTRDLHSHRPVRFKDLLPSLFSHLSHLVGHLTDLKLRPFACLFLLAFSPQNQLGLLQAFVTRKSALGFLLLLRHALLSLEQHLLTQYC